MLHRLSALALSALLLQLAMAYDEIGFAQAVGDASKGCFGLQSTFVRTNNTVVFDLGNGTYDASSKSVNLTYDEEGRTSGKLQASGGNVTYTVVANGSTCAYTLEVMAGTFLGVAGASKPDTAGIVMVDYDQARSDAGAACVKAHGGQLAVITVGGFAAAGGRIGHYDAASKKATFVSGFDNIFTVSPSADGKSLTADLQSNGAKTKCAYNLKVVDGSVMGVTA